MFRGTVSVPAAVFDAAHLRLETPTPRAALGQALRGVATNAIDLSDGLLGDLVHVLKQSGVGATVDVDIATESIAARARYTVAEGQKDLEIDLSQQRRWALTGGDDYELLFTAPPSARDAVAGAARDSQTLITRIGQVDAAPGVRLVDRHGKSVDDQFSFFDHFV